MPLEFTPKGYCETVLLSKGIYTLEVWGAQGGNCTEQSKGFGGYSKGRIFIREPRFNLTVCVGLQGQNTVDSIDPIGGFNGGGNGTKKSGCCSGGG